MDENKQETTNNGVESLATEPQLPKLAQFLLKQRIKSQRTQMQIAHDMGYQSPQFVSNWERGAAMPPSNRIKDIAKAYRVKPIHLLEYYVLAHRDSLIEKNKIRE